MPRGGFADGGECHFLTRQAEVFLKGFSEEFVDEVDEVRGGAPGLAESACLFGSGHSGENEFGVGTAKPIDGLLHVADPDDPLGALRETGEEGELDGAGILEFIDDEQVDFIR